MAVLPSAAPVLADAFEIGTNVLPKTIPMNEDLADVFDTLADFSEDPMVRAGVNQLTRLASSLKPTLNFIAPVQTTCNYATLLFRNAASLFSDGDTQRQLAALHHHLGPDPARHAGHRAEQRERALGRARQRARLRRTTSTSTRTRTPPRRARRASARPATSATRSGRTVLTNPPGNQGTRTPGAGTR